MSDVIANFLGSLCAERGEAEQHLVEDYPHTPPIHPLVIGAISENLRSNVLWSPNPRINSLVESVQPDLDLLGFVQLLQLHPRLAWPSCLIQTSLNNIFITYFTSPKSMSFI